MHTVWICTSVCAGVCTPVHVGGSRECAECVCVLPRVSGPTPDRCNRVSDRPQGSRGRPRRLPYSLSRIAMHMRMATMAPVPRPAAATAPAVVQSPFSSQGHTLTLMMDVLDRGGFPESVTMMGTSYTPASRYRMRRLSWA